MTIPGIERIPIQIHSIGAIRGALKAVNDHKTGLPEFIKNGAGAYHRLPDDLLTKKTREDRILILFFKKPRGRAQGSIGCLDLVGMTNEDIKLFQKWFDPTAASRGDLSAQLWGGHGNGAKSYMLSFFNEAWFASIRDGCYTQMGWKGMRKKDIYDENYKIGYIPSRLESDAKLENKPLERLDSLLRTEFRANLELLPRRAIEILQFRPTWTCFVGKEAKSWLDPERLLELIKHNPQTIRAIEYCSIYSFIDGIAAMGGKPLNLEKITPLPGGEAPYEFAVPISLSDPDGDDVDTTSASQYPVGKLVLHTSKDPMLYSLKSRHVIRCESSLKGIIGLFEIEYLAGRYADHIYGEIYLEALQEYETNFRHEPYNSPLTRAVKEWIKEQVLSYAATFSAQEQIRRNDRETKDLQELNAHMNQFLRSFLEESDAEVGNSRNREVEILKRTGRSQVIENQVARIEHNLGNGIIVCGENISLYVRLEFFGVDGQRVRPIPVHWETTVEAVAFAELGSIITGQPGECEISAVAENGVRGTPINIKVIPIDSIQITPETSPLVLGSKRYLKYAVISGENVLTSVRLNWYSNNEDFVKIGSNEGIITATAAPGVAELWAYAQSVESNHINVQTVDDMGTGKEATQHPKILLSEIDDDPDTGAPKNIPSDEGTVVQDIADRRRNIYWVNMNSPIANQFLQIRNYRSAEFRVYLAEKYAEVVFRNLLRRGDNILEPDDIEELLSSEPTRLRQVFADHFQEWLTGTWPI